MNPLKILRNVKCSGKHQRNFYRPQQSWGKVMFLQASVILLTLGGSTWPGTPPGPGTPPRIRYTPQTRYLQTRYTPLDQVHPPGPGTPPDQVHPLDQVPPLGPGTPTPDQVHPPAPGTPQTRYTPQDQVPPRPGTPPLHQVPPGPGTPPRDQVHPPVQSMLGDTVNARSVRILLECNLLSSTFPAAQFEAWTQTIREFPSQGSDAL